MAFAASQLVGWVLLLTVTLALRDRVGGSRWGARLVATGCALQIAFAVAYGVLSAALGEPDESVFVLFLAAFLSLTVGGLVWGLRIVRRESLAGRGLIAVATLGFLAIAAGVDPFHDLLLLSLVRRVDRGRSRERCSHRPRDGWRRVAISGRPAQPLVAAYRSSATPERSARDSSSSRWGNEVPSATRPFPRPWTAG